MMVIAEPKPTDGFRWTQTPWGHGLVCLALEPYAAHLFTAGDIELRNNDSEWAAVAAFLQVPRDRIRLVSQVHGTEIAAIHRELPASSTPPRADGMVSDDDSVAIGVRVADCAPILIADTAGRAVAAVHAGWRGTMQAIAGVAVSTLEKEFGCRAGELIAAIGPCLGPCCGEMGPEIVDMFLAAGHDGGRVDRWFRTGESGRPYFDLWRANREQLEDAGMRPEHILTAGLCTRTHSSVFHSYRAKGTEAGRMLGIIRAARLPLRPFGYGVRIESADGAGEGAGTK
jgi:YfiH family protein